MSPLAWVGVALLGGVGAVSRFLIDAAVSRRASRGLPVGTFLINISGSFVLGLLDGLALSGTALVLVGTATVGAFTTFSTWMLETHRLREDARFLAAAGNLLLSLGVGLGAVAMGRLVGTAL